MATLITAPPCFLRDVYFTQELRPLRQQNQDLQMEYDEKKSIFDSTSLQLQVPRYSSRFNSSDDTNPPYHHHPTFFYIALSY